MSLGNLKTLQRNRDRGMTRTNTPTGSQSKAGKNSYQDQGQEILLLRRSDVSEFLSPGSVKVRALRSFSL